MDAQFFPTSDDLRLFGVARGPQNAAHVWVMCPPFAEEEKSSRRLFTLLAQDFAARGQASLVFSFRGTGDSEGDFAAASLTAWKRDLAAAKTEAQSRFPRTELGLIGVRLGASLAWQQAEELGATRLILIEPLLSGRSFLMQQSAKKQIRAQLTGENGASTSETVKSESAVEDLDGWELGQTLKTELSALDLKRQIPRFSGSTTLFQIGPRPEIAPSLQTLLDSSGARAQALVMPPFWNLIDAPNFAPLVAAVAREVSAAEATSAFTPESHA